MVPLNSFPLKKSDSSVVIFPTDDVDSWPDISFRDKSMDRNRGRWKRADGMTPVRALSLKSISSRETRLETASGIVPVTMFTCRSMEARFE
jgi:hypothetical protein